MTAKIIKFDEEARQAILKGAKQKSPDFSLKGIDSIITELRGLEAIGELAELGDLGVVATAASVGAASGVLATISKWLKPVKNIFSKMRGKSAVKKLAKQVSQGKEVSDKLRQRAEQYEQQQAAEQQAYQPIPQNAVQPPNANIPTTPFVAQQTPTNMARTPTPVNTKKA